MEVRGIMAASGSTDFDVFGRCTSYYHPPLEKIQRLGGHVRSNSLTDSSVGLKLLVIEGDCFRSQSGVLSTDLIWLRWYDGPHRSIPPWLSMKSLRVLELLDGRLEELWRGDEQIEQLPLQLRELKIMSRNGLRKFPKSIGLLKKLEKIVFRGPVGLWKEEFLSEQFLPEEFCSLQSLEHLVLINSGGRLTSLPNSFGRLQSFKYLEIRDSDTLASLPQSFGHLQSLRHLDLVNRSNLASLPKSFGGLTQLEYLDLSGCTSLMIEPENFTNITTLEHLNLSYCMQLTTLPAQITFQESLKKLILYGTSLQELPSEVCKLSNLQDLKIGSLFLKSLPPSLANLTCLTQLNLDGCEQLECLPESLGGLDHLTLLEVSNCRELKCLPESVGQLNVLAHLTMSRSGIECLPKGFAKLRNLETLRIEHCPISTLTLGRANSRNLDFRTSARYFGFL